VTESIQGDALDELIDTGPCESDRTFFRHHPRRNFRLRPAWTIEIDDFIHRGGIKTHDLPDGTCWWMLVRKLAPHWRVRYPIVAPDYLFADPPEEIVHGVWRRYMPPSWKKLVRDLQRKISRAEHDRP